VEILSMLSGHPLVVGFKEVFEDRHYCHIVMELCKGG
jgi:serine/threonine protein kinase